jgi:hypothetical protein
MFQKNSDCRETAAIHIAKYEKYLSQSDLNLLSEILEIKTGQKFKHSNVFSDFSSDFSDQTVFEFSQRIEKRAACFRGKCLDRIHEIIRHHSDRHYRDKFIKVLIKAYDKFERAAAGRDFI